MLGIDIRQSTETGATKVIIRASIYDSEGAPITTGTAYLRLAQLQTDGTLKFWDTGTTSWRTGSNAPSQLSMTYVGYTESQTGFGLWTYVADAGDDAVPFITSGIYFANVYHASGYPLYQEREFQYGGIQGDNYFSKFLTIDGANVDAVFRNFTITTEAITTQNITTQAITSQVINECRGIFNDPDGIYPISVNLTQIGGSATPVTKLTNNLSVVVSGTVTDTETPSTTGFSCDLTEDQTSLYVGRTLIFLTGDNKYKAVTINSYTTGIIGTTTMTVAPSADDTFIIV